MGYKKDLLVYSGGLDSTYMLQNTLCYKNVDTLYIRSGQTDPLKTKMELKLRDRNIQILNKNYPYSVINDYIIDDPGYKTHSSQPVSQPITWLTSIFRVLQPDIYDRVIIGYVREDGGDGFVDMKEAFKNLWSMTYLGLNDPPDLEFPLALYSKLHILEYIDLRLLQNIWVCETPSMTMNKTDIMKHGGCGQCMPCLIMRGMLCAFEKKHDVDISVVFKDRDAVNRAIKSKNTQPEYNSPTTGWISSELTRYATCEEYKIFNFVDYTDLDKKVNFIKLYK